MSSQGCSALGSGMAGCEERRADPDDGAADGTAKPRPHKAAVAELDVCFKKHLTGFSCTTRACPGILSTFQAPQPKGNP
jgi:hypothetical protein